MRSPLNGLNVDSLTVSAQLETVDDIWETLGEGESNPIIHRRVMIVGGYRRNQAWHQVVLTASRHDELWDLVIEYSCPAVINQPLSNPPSHVRSGMVRLATMLKSRATRDLNIREVTINLSYKFDASKVATLIPIPFLRNDDPTSAFTEIRGIKLVKEGRRFEAYSAELEIVEATNRVEVELDFLLEDRFNEKSAEKGVQRAQQIINRLISKRGVNND